MADKKILDEEQLEMINGGTYDDEQRRRIDEILGHNPNGNTIQIKDPPVYELNLKSADDECDSSYYTPL